jgi:hypothetical protein
MSVFATLVAKTDTFSSFSSTVIYHYDILYDIHIISSDFYLIDYQ